MSNSNVEPSSSQRGMTLALRSRSSGKQDAPRGRTIQSPQNRSGVDQPSNISQWPNYEQSRGEELRRQIRAKEAELESITQNKDRIRLRMLQTSLNGRLPGQDLSSASDLNPQSSQFMQQSNNTISPPPNNRQYASDVPQSATSLGLQNPQAIQRSAIFTPSTPIQPPGVQSNFAINSNQDLVSNISSENQQMQRRLGLVQQELERVIAERNESMNHLHNLTKQTDVLQQQIDHEQRDQSSAQRLNSHIDEEKENKENIHQRMLDATKKGKEAELRADQLRNIRPLEIQTNKEMQAGLDNKIAMIKDIESKIFYNRSLLDNVENQITSLDRQLQNDQHDVSRLTDVVNRQVLERNEIHDKLLSLNQIYDQTVEEISQERAQIAYNNRRHTKLIASKIIYQSLLEVQQRKMHDSFKEIQKYSQFDSSCHQKLSSFKQVLENLGKNKLSHYLKKWFILAHEPLRKQLISNRVIEKIYLSKLVKRTFAKWMSAHRNRQNQYAAKLEAIERIWVLKSKDCHFDVKRSFQVWRMLYKYQVMKEKRLKIVIGRQESSLVRQCFNWWNDYSQEVTGFVRRHLLTTEYSNKQLMQIAFHQLKIRMQRRKRIRLFRLSHLFKAWQDSNAYRRYMINQNVQVSHLRRQLNLKLMSSCFQALKISKENEKHNLVKSELEGKVQPRCVQVTEAIQDTSGWFLRLRKLRCMRVLSKQAILKVSTYFEHWLCMYKGYKWKLKKNLIEMVNRAYREKMHTAFNTWRHGNGFIKIYKQVNTVRKLATKGIYLQSQVNTIQKQIQDEENRIARLLKASFTRVSKIYNKHAVLKGLDIWYRNQRRWYMMKNIGAPKIFRILRQNYITQAFKTYRQVSEKLKLLESSEQRANHYLKTRQTRQMRKCYNAICQFYYKYERAKRILGQLFDNTDLWLQKRTFYRWQDQGNAKAISQLKNAQNNNSEQYDQINQVLGEKVKQKTLQEQENVRLRQEHLNLAYKMLGNYFGRFYYTKAHRGMHKWKQVIQNIQHKEAVYGNIIRLWRRNWDFMVRQAWKRWIHYLKQMRLKEQTRNQGILIAEVEQSQATDLELFQNEERRLKGKILRRDLRTRIIEGLLNRLENYQFKQTAQNDCWTSRKRFCLNLWRQYVKEKRQKLTRLVFCFQKSMLQTGFNSISDVNRADILKFKRSRHAIGMLRMFQKQNFRVSFAKWCSLLLFDSITQKQLAEQMRENEELTHQQFKERTLMHNWQMWRQRQRRLRLMNLVKAWQTVHKWLYTKRVQAENLQQKYWQDYKIRRALLKWCQRKQWTVKYRAMTTKFNSKRKLIYQRAVFDSLSYVFRNQERFCVRLSNLAQKFNNLVKLIAMQRIKNHAKNKYEYDRLKKRIACRELESILRHIVQIKMGQHLSQLRANVLRKKARQLTIGAMFGHWFGMGLRYAFFKWKDTTKKLQVVEEVNEQGPVVEEQLYWWIRYNNCKYFLRDEAYTRQEINEIAKWAYKRQRGLISTSIARLKHQNPENDKNLKPKMFDRWKQFVKLRKLVKYLLQNMENRLQPVNADQSIAFIRWKKKCFNKDYLQNRAHLIAKSAHMHEKAQHLLGVEEQATDFNEQLQLQRDELIEKYIGSQRLAIALGRDNSERRQKKGLSKLSDHANIEQQKSISNVLQKNIDFIEQLKSKIKEFENDNDSVANENEELRQFSLNGYQIAKNVQQLQHEREQLSVDLADKTATIKDLLNQNDSLNYALKHMHNHMSHTRSTAVPPNTSNQKVNLSYNY